MAMMKKEILSGGGKGARLIPALVPDFAKRASCAFRKGLE